MSLTAFSLHTRPHRRIFLARTIRQCCNSVSYSSTAGHQHNIFFGLGSLNRLLDGYLWFHTHFWVKIIFHAVLGGTRPRFLEDCKSPNCGQRIFFPQKSPCSAWSPYCLSVAVAQWLRVNSEGYEHERKKLSSSREHYVLLSFITREGVESLKSGY